jgi:hypothetical protein
VATFKSTEANKALTRRGFEEVFNQKNLAVLDELVVAEQTTVRESENSPLYVFIAVSNS